MIRTEERNLSIYREKAPMNCKERSPPPPPKRLLTENKSDSSKGRPANLTTPDNVPNRKLQYGPGSTSSGLSTDTTQVEEYTNKIPWSVERRENKRPPRKSLNEQELWKPEDEIKFEDIGKKQKK